MVDLVDPDTGKDMEPTEAAIEETIGKKTLEAADSHYKKPDSETKPEERDITFVSFSAALAFIKEGKRVSRKGWNGKDMWIELIEAGNAMCGQFAMQDCIGMKTVDNVMQPGWLASQADLLDEDWFIVT